MNICFDCDECLIEKGKPIEANVMLLKVLADKHKIYLWSGNGYKHALEIAEQLGISSIIEGVLNKYNTFIPDIAFDNQEIKLGLINVKL